MALSSFHRFGVTALVLSAALVSFGGQAKQAGYDPLALMLTWRQDPTTTMTIDWHSLPKERRSSRLEYRELGAVPWRTVFGEIRAYPHSDRVLHRAELTGLKPGTLYEFRFDVTSRVFRFKTMPATAAEPIRVAVGGDTMHSQEWLERTNRAAMKHDPDFILWAGDIFYCGGRASNVHRVFQFFDALKKTLIHPDGRVVPVVAAIGNHEVREGYFFLNEDAEESDAWRSSAAPYFYALFAFPGHPGYNVLDFGDYMSLVILDSDHSNPIHGRQEAWLEEVLEARQHVPHLFPVYHVPAYPSHRSFVNGLSDRVRDHWVPLFEAYGVEVAFEAHDHLYKRTQPMLNGAVHPNGIVYVGDGAWGVATREPNPDNAWYLAEAQARRHFVMLTIQGDQRRMDVFDEYGVLFDAFGELPSPEPPDAGSDPPNPPDTPPAPVLPPSLPESAPAPLRGDVNNDGKVDAIDVQLVIRAALGLSVPSGYAPDVNENGRVDAGDIQSVINAALGL